ncbi:hypothetical protein FANTH_4610 [Fusarium anthophilum]|uniref:Uncharacterized protein n=1 Tax=Fusarium anthophilum TaxID=48485 RepID=A0A8H5E7Q2_9HYPO|nr:hypothetical protein FANTH_4610 [Fusarium anthophilum]
MVILWAEASPGQAGDKQRSEGLNAIRAYVHWVRIFKLRNRRGPSKSAVDKVEPEPMPDQEGGLDPIVPSPAIALHEH